MQRCIQLAQLGFATVAPNPLVGAVLVYNNIIIGEGFHMQYGKAHAEVNCINNVSEKNKHLIKDAILYVSLEPCNHYGNTPPCTKTIVANEIKTVVVGCVDTHSKVNGAGIQFLQLNGVKVITPVLQNECKQLNEMFFYAKQHNIPYVTLKWAQSADGFINEQGNKRTLFTNHCTNVWVHKLRAAHQAILVGSSTVQFDNPTLNKRFYGGFSATVIVIDRFLQIDLLNKKLINNQKVFVINTLIQKTESNVVYIKIENNESFIKNMLLQLFQNGIQSILVEGGATVLQLLLQHNFYNRVIQIINEQSNLLQGSAAPNKWSLPLHSQCYIQNNTINIFKY
jgi:diaminohydroxyphosphoribosylaminopyrimidine deaminase/5-amino-6-(5-phosphoribosylamino)uracil reductase